MTDRKQTTLGAALEAVGLNPAEYRLAAAVQEFLKQGGTVNRSHALVDEVAKRMPGEGRKEVASDGRLPSADARQQVEGGEASCTVPSGLSGSASPPSSNRDVEGHMTSANHSQIRLATPVARPSPVRSARGLAAIASTQITMKRGYLLIHKTSDGRSWGNVGWHELDGMKRDGAIARLLKERVPAPLKYTATLNEVLTDAQFMEIYDASQKQIGSSAV